MDINHLPGVSSHFVRTKRLRHHLLSFGNENGIPVIFIHGNFSSSTYFEELMVAMPAHFYSLAVDLRGYGKTEDQPIDATRGARDWADDLLALLDELGIPSAHLVSWSAGAAATQQLLIQHPDRVSSLTLIAPVSPFGFGGSKGSKGTPCYSDYSGSGAGLVPAEFVKHIEQQDRGTDSHYSPRNIIRTVFVFNNRPLSREEDLLTGSLQQKTGAHRYPGDFETSAHWPYSSPGQYGPINAVSAKHLKLDQLSEINPKPPILWIRGDQDCVISNSSMSDLAILGQQKLIPDWPGNEIFPPQPMLDQTRLVLESYQKNGGDFQEVVIPNTGHSPFLENPEAFMESFHGFLQHHLDK